MCQNSHSVSKFAKNWGVWGLALRKFFLRQSPSKRRETPFCTPLTFMPRKRSESLNLVSTNFEDLER